MQSNISLQKNPSTTALTLKNVALIFYFLFWLLKPFYLKNSGSLQIGDLFLGFSFIFLWLGDGFSINLRKIDNYFYLFFISVCLINIIYSMIYLETAFLTATLYYVFNFMVIYLYREFENTDNFYNNFARVLKINIIVQVVVYIIGKGEWFGGLRYMGTYNDPNQLAFGILSTYCLLFCISRIIKIKFRVVYFIISVFIIYQSASTGILMAIAILFVFEQYFRISDIKEGFTKTFYVIYLVIITTVVIILGVEFLSVISGKETDILLFKQIVSKLNKGDNFIESFIRDRCLYSIVNAPIYTLFGAGEALYTRFSDYATEMHSTWLTFLFCYGIIPFLFIITWVKHNLKKIDLCVIPVYACLFIEAFTLINHRQPAFWTLIALAHVLKRKSEEMDNKFGVI